MNSFLCKKKKNKQKQPQNKQTAELQYMKLVKI